MSGVSIVKTKLEELSEIKVLLMHNFERRLYIYLTEFVLLILSTVLIANYDVMVAEILITHGVGRE